MSDVRERIALAKARIRSQINAAKTKADSVNIEIDKDSENYKKIKADKVEKKADMWDKKMPLWRKDQLEEIAKRRSGIIVGSAKTNLEAKTQQLLSRFTSSLKEATKEPAVLEKTDKGLPCALHSVAGCKSCTFIMSNAGSDMNQEEAEEGWQSHKLVFEKEAGERLIKKEAGNLVVIDPRERIETVSKKKCK